jgi:hypothetical protein
MSPRTISPRLSSSPRKLVPMVIVLGAFLASCGPVPAITPGAGAAQPSQTAAADTATPTPQVVESTPAPTSASAAEQTFSSDALGLCFSYPEGYLQLPYEDTVEIVAPDPPGSEPKALFWLEKSDSYARTAEVIADQDMTAAGLPSVARSFVTLDGEQAVVLDGMPGQDLQRRVYVVRDQTLYVLAFMPTRSTDQAASDQMEALYAAILGSWKWSPCPAPE